MKVLIFILLTTLVLQIKTDDSLILDNNSFLIYNKVYHKARLTQFGTDEDDVGSYEYDFYSDQLWTLDPHPSRKGCYYIVNEKHSQYRIANHKHSMIVYSGPYYNDQLFKFVPSGKNDGFYYIYSCHYTNDRITKFSSSDSAVGMYDGPKYNDQLWRLVPRFKANIYTDEVFHFDNRQGSNPIKREVSLTYGIKRSTTDTVRNKVTYKQSMEASISGIIKMFNVGATSKMEFSSELETSFSETNEQSWSKTEKVTFVVPPGKNFKVMQHAVDFEGAFDWESCSLLTSIKIFESDNAYFDDPDNFIMSYVQ